MLVILLCLFLLAGNIFAQEIIYQERFNKPDEHGWKIGGLWKVDDSPNVQGGSHLGDDQNPYSLNYNNDIDYDTPDTPNSGSARSPVVNISSSSNTPGVLKFWCNYDTETNGLEYDIRVVRILGESGAPIVEYQIATENGAGEPGLCAEMGVWHEHKIYLDSAWGNISIEFYFDTIDHKQNKFCGWFIDDVRIERLSGESKTIYGTLYYEYPKDKFNPLSLTEIEVYDEYGNYLTKTCTDKEGFYYVNVPDLPADTKYVIRAMAMHKDGVIEVRLLLCWNMYYNDTTSILNSPGDYTFSLYEDSKYNYFCRALHIKDITANAYEHVAKIISKYGSDDCIHPVTVIWPRSWWWTGEYAGGVMYLAWGVSNARIYHVFAHHVMACLSDFPALDILSTLYFNDPKFIKYFYRHYPQGIYDVRFSWFQGWAHYFACDILNSTNLSYHDWYGYYNFDIENPPDTYPPTPANEVRVAGALWDLRNSVQNGSAKIIQVLDQLEESEACDITTFYKKWVEITSLSSKAINAFTPHGIYPEGIEVNPDKSYIQKFDSVKIYSSPELWWSEGWARHCTSPRPWGISSSYFSFPSWWADNIPEGSPYSPQACINYNSHSFKTYELCYSYSFWSGYTYEYQLRNAGYVESPLIDISSCKKPVLMFLCKYEIEPPELGNAEKDNMFDKRILKIFNQDFTSILYEQQLDYDSCGLMNSWHLHKVTLQPQWGKIRVRFFFDTYDWLHNNYSGWFIDDFTIAEDESHFVSTPSQPQGPQEGTALETYQYTTGGSQCSYGHQIEYKFYWGDQTYSAWITDPTTAKSWQNHGTYTVMAIARCKGPESILSKWSAPLSIQIQPHLISTPAQPSGHTQIKIGYEYIYTTSGADCALGHQMEYMFDWGDESQGEWTGDTQSKIWESEGTFHVKVKARCSAGAESLWSEPLAVETIPHTVLPPSKPSGQTKGVVSQTFAYSTSDSVCSYGDAIQYRFTWGDETQSLWGEATQSKTWLSEGTFYVNAQARCSAGIESGWGEALEVKISPHTVQTPQQPSGETEGIVNQSYHYTTGGASCNLGHQIEYRFYWGDDTYSQWGGGEASKSWSEAGTYYPNTQARCSEGVESNWSGGLKVVIYPVHEVLTPSKPSGITSGKTNQSYSFSTGGSACTHGHSIQYQFDWDDGTQSSWGQSSQSKSWIQQGTYHVKARAKCSGDITSEWSQPLKVEIFVYHGINSPVKPSGETTVVILQDYQYTSGGSACSLGHEIEYQFDWGEGTQSLWGEESQVHSWQVAGAYQIRVRAKCSQNKISEWSESLEITVHNSHTISTPQTPSGQTDGYVNTDYQYVTGNSTCTLGHQIEYQFDWGDGTVSLWTEGVDQKSWSAGGTYYVKAKARCSQDIESEWSGELEVCITLVHSVTKPDMPAGETEGLVNEVYSYTTGGAQCSYGHQIAYQFYWGDGTSSQWGETTQSKSWSETGTYSVSARARCSEGLESDLSDSLSVVIQIPHTITTPQTPSGQTEGIVDEQYTYTTGDSVCSHSHEIKYKFDWGDNTSDEWGGTSRTKSWQQDGTFAVKAIARCSAGLASDWSGSLTVKIEIPHKISKPQKPSGQTTGVVNQIYVYKTTGASCSKGHDVVYQFNWGDGAKSLWGLPEQEKSWAEDGEYFISCVARCSEGLESGWSNVLKVVVKPEHTISTPSKPSGQEYGQVGKTYSFITNGAVCSYGHQIKYRFDWGDGIQTTEEDGQGEKAWLEEGSYDVKVRAECAVLSNSDDGPVSAWSEPHKIKISIEHKIYKPAKPSGVSEGLINQIYQFETNGTHCSFGHNIEYKFDWGDGEQSTWGSIAQQKAWSEAGTYYITVKAKCGKGLISEWSDVYEVKIVSHKLTKPSIPSGERCGYVNQVYTYQTDAWCSSGHIIEFQFNWGDGIQSQWGGALQEKSWSQEGTYLVKARARCSGGFETGWSDAIKVKILIPHEVSTPLKPEGPLDGEAYHEYQYTTGDSQCSFGHPVKYRFDWGDGGGPDSWGEATQSVIFVLATTYVITAQARCEKGVESEWSESILVDIKPEHKVSMPEKPAGENVGGVGIEYTYVTGGAKCKWGHGVVYEFDWGDGTQSSWGGATNKKTWTQQGTYYVRARAKCEKGVKSEYSNHLKVQIKGHSVSKPSRPDSFDRYFGFTNKKYWFCTDRSLCSLGHAIEYQFDWGDAEGDFGLAKQAHSWSSQGVFYVRARARCSEGMLSEWSTSTKFYVAIIYPPQPDLPQDGSGDVSNPVKIAWTLSGKSPFDLYGRCCVMISRYADVDSMPMIIYNTGEFTIQEQEFSIQKDFEVNLPGGCRYYWKIRFYVSPDLQEFEGICSQVVSFDSVGEGTVPTIPAPVAPQDGESISCGNVNFSWTESEGDTPIYYRLQIDTNSNFSKPHEIVGIKQTSCSFSGLTGNTTYYWRVKAYNDVGESAWSKTSYFSTPQLEGQLPYRPRLWYPYYGQEYLPLQVTLKWYYGWHGGSQFCTFEMDIATDCNFKNRVIHAVNISKTHYNVTLPAGGVIYYWRVRAKNSVGFGPWSKTYHFKTVKQGEVPSAPVLIYPQDNTYGFEAPFFFDWSDSSGTAPIFYELQISEKADFACPVVIRKVISLSEYCIQEGILAGGQTYYWRVRASNSAGYSGWSQVRIFTTFSSGIAPSTPVLMEPEHDAWDLPTRIKFAWTESDGTSPVFYRLQVAVDKLFEDVVKDAAGITLNQFCMDNLKLGKTYYWRVRAYNEAGQSGWSSTFVFHTMSPPSSGRSSGGGGGNCGGSILLKNLPSAVFILIIILLFAILFLRVRFRIDAFKE